MRDFTSHLCGKSERKVEILLKKKKTDIYQRAINKSLPNPEEDCIDDEGSGKLCYVLRVNHPLYEDVKTGDFKLKFGL